MREVEQKGALAGLFGTVLVWILIFLFFYFGAVILKPKEYKTIKIRLDSAKEQVFKKEEVRKNNELVKTEKKDVKQTQNSQKGEASPSLQPASQSSATPSAGVSPATPPKTPEPARPAQTKQSQPAKKTPAAKQAQPKQSQPTKQVTSKTTEQPKMAEQTLQKSIDELMAEQQQKKTTKKAFDWSQFDEMEGNSSSSNSTASAKNNALSSAQNAFSGSAASSAQGSSGAKSESKSNSKSAENQSVSSSTKNALSQAVSAHKYSSSTSNVSSTVTADTSNSNGHVSIKMSDGVPRILLEPAEPKIVLSAEAASLIDSTKQLTISFTVTAGGTVPVANIKISPDILPSIVSMEIKEQISRWRFQSAPSDGQAQFSYTIKNK